MPDPGEVLRALGLARRAGRAVVGAGALKEASADGDLHLVVLATDATDNAVGRLRGAVERSGAARIRVGTRAELGSALGRGPVAAVGVTDRGLAERIRQLAARRTGDETNTIHTS